MENNLFQLIQQGRRIALGAIASCAETLQDPQKRAEAIANLQTELNQKTQEWSAKGEVTEAEVKAFMENLMAQRGWQGGKYPSSTDSDKTRTAANSNLKLQELTAEIIALKLELEKLRKSKNN